MSTFWVSGGQEGGEEATRDEGEAEENGEARPSSGQAWEIDFGPSDADTKPKKLPRFLSRPKPQTHTVSVMASPSPSSTTSQQQHGLRAGKTGQEKGKPLSPARPTYNKSTPSRGVTKPRTVSSAPAKTSGSKLAPGSASSKSSAQSRTSTPKSSTSATPSSSRLGPAKGTGRGTAARTTNSPLSAAISARPASAPSSESKPSNRNSSGKSLFSKRKSTPSTAGSKEGGREKSGRKLSAIWRKKGSKKQMKTRDDFSEKSSEGGGSVSKIPQARGISLHSPGLSRAAGRGGRVSASSKKSSVLQSSYDMEDGWAEEEEEDRVWVGATDERGFDTSGATKGSWSIKQQENFERIHAEQFSPRLQTTPDIPNSKATRRKLKEVQRWVHEVSVHTHHQQQQLGVGEGGLPLERGGGREVRMAVVPEEMATRKVLDLRRW